MSCGAILHLVGRIDPKDEFSSTPRIHPKRCQVFGDPKVQFSRRQMLEVPEYAVASFATTRFLYIPQPKRPNAIRLPGNEAHPEGMVSEIFLAICRKPPRIGKALISDIFEIWSIKPCQFENRRLQGPIASRNSIFKCCRRSLWVGRFEVAR